MTSGWFAEGSTAYGVRDGFVHRIEPGADTETLGEIRYWWSPAPCRAMCITVPPGLPPNLWPRCPQCFPKGQRREVPKKPQKPVHLYDKDLEDMTEEEKNQFGQMELDDYFSSHGEPSRYAPEGDAPS